MKEKRNALIYSARLILNFLLFCTKLALSEDRFSNRDQPIQKFKNAKKALKIMMHSLRIAQILNHTTRINKTLIIYIEKTREESRSSHFEKWREP